MASTNKSIAKINVLQKIPKGWSVVKFGDVFDFIKSEAFSREDLTDVKTEKGIQNIHYGDIHATFDSEILDFDFEKRIPFIIDEKLNGSAFTFIKDGDLIIADASEDYAGVAECVEVKNIGKRKVVGGLHTFVARDKGSKTVDGFRSYILRNPSVRLNLKRIATGSNVYGISKTNLAELKIILPPKPEQTKIAKLLATCDTAIELTEILVAIKEKLKQELTLTLFTKGKRFKEFRNKKWEEVKIKDYYSLNGETISEKFPQYAEFYYLDLSAVKEGVISFPKEKISFETAPSRARRILKQNNIIMATVRPNLKGFAVADFNVKEIVCSTGFALINTQDKLDAYFLYHLINSSIVASQIENLVVGSNYPAINNTDVENITIPFPSEKTERDKIALALSTCDKEIQLLKNKRNALKRQKNGLMNVLLTGKKRVKV